MIVYIRNKDTGETKQLRVKIPWRDKTLWEKFLTVIGLRKEPGTLSATGARAVMRMYGGSSDTPTYGVINRITHNGGSGYAGELATVTVTEVDADTIRYRNAAGQEFGDTGVTPATYIGLANSSYGSTPFHTILLSGSGLSCSSSYEWWVEIDVTIG